jgi:hypothetical protein
MGRPFPKSSGVFDYWHKPCKGAIRDAIIPLLGPCVQQFCTYYGLSTIQVFVRDPP